MKEEYISRRDKVENYPDYSIKQIEEHNQRFIQKEKQKHKKYFKEMFQGIDSNIILDDEQIEAIITDEDYEMIIAGAGSGKTTTMAAKVKYLVEIKKIPPKEIMMISYTNEAVNELKDRIQIGFQIPVEIATFHKLCFNIIKKDCKNIQILEDPYIIIQKYFHQKRKCYHKYLLYHHFKNYFLYYIQNKVNKTDMKLCNDFLNRFQTNGYESFQYFFKKYRKNKKVMSFLKLMQDITKYYQNELNKHHLIDFDGMIQSCYKKLEGISLSYRYLIIDEYQDISYIRFCLIKKIAMLYHTKIIVVGDDFQSIYSFSGSNLSLFVDFKKKMGYAKCLKITNTYRNSQELIYMIGSFVMKNPFQISKHLSSNKHLVQPIVLVEYKNNKQKKLEQILQTIIIKYGQKKNILLLGRYINDINFLIESSYFQKKQNKIYYKKYPSVSITFLTVHASKGLGFDNVILLNNEDTLYGFPSKIKDHRYLKILTQKQETYPYSEERRLFYVALTRTKNQVYLLYPKKNPSIFLLELQKLIKNSRK